MGLLSRLLDGRLRAGVPGPASDYWYNPVGMVSASGVRVDVEAAQKVSAFFSGLRLLSNDVAKLPLEIFQRQADGGKQRARGNPLYDIVHTQPNIWQTSFEWRRQGMRHLILRGNWYNRILPGPRGVVDQLVPILPDLVVPEQVPSGRIVYHVRDPKTNAVTTSTQDEIFHVRGVSDDGIEGKSILSWARDSLGVALSTETYASKLFSQGSLHSGVITVPGVLDDDASKRMANSFVTSASDWHKPKVLEQGAEYKETTLTPEDSQFLLSRQFSVTEMARWLGLPPHKIQDLSKATFSNIEEQNIDYVVDGLSPWLVLIESAIDRDLILAPRLYFAEFNADALMRGNAQARGEYYKAMFSVGAYSQNDIRKKENENSIPGGDTYFVPANFRPSDEPFTAATQGGVPDVPPAPPAKNVPPAKPSSDDRVRPIVTESAARLLRKEQVASQKAAVKYAADPAGFAVWATEFYKTHEALVAQTMQLDALTSQLYCDSQRDDLIAHGMSAAEGWTTGYLVGLALDSPRPDPMAVALVALASKPEARVTIAEGAVQVHPASVVVNQPPAKPTKKKITFTKQGGDPTGAVIEET